MYASTAPRNASSPVFDTWFRKYTYSHKQEVINTFRSNGDQLHSFTCYEVQRFVDVSNLMKPHLPSVWLR